METGQPAGGTRLDGRTRLLDTAEELLDQYGIDGVSVRTVTKAAGHRNSSAVNYHFGDREQLIVAVLERRRLAVEARRQALLEALEADGELTPGDAVLVALQPLVELLDEPAGRRYLRLLHQASIHPDYLGRNIVDFSPAAVRARASLLPLVQHLPRDLRVHRLRLAANVGLAALCDQARLIDSPEPPRPVVDSTVLLDDAVKSILAVLTA